MNQLGGFPLLTLIVALPALGALISIAVPRERRDTLRWLAILIAASDLIIALLLNLGWVEDSLGGLQFVDGPWAWLGSLGTTYHLGVDGLNLHLVLLTALTSLLLMLAPPEETDQIKRQTILALVLETALLGALVSQDLVPLAIFWLMAMVVVFLLLAQEPRQATSAAQFLGAAALVALAFIIAIAIALANTEGTNLHHLQEAALPWRTQMWIFIPLLIACAITSATFPLHTWFPTLCREKPTLTQIWVSSLMLNLGGYGLIRLCLRTWPLAAASATPMLLVIGTLGILYAALAARGQKSLAHVLAYWRVAQNGLLLIGVFTMEDVGLHGSIIQLSGMSLAMTALQLLLREQPSTDSAGASPAANRWLVRLPALSAIGLPGLVGFVGQGLLVMQICKWNWFASESEFTNALLDWGWRTLVTAGLLIGIGALVRATRTILRSAVPGRDQQAQVVLPLVLLVVLLGTYATLVSDVIGPTVYRTLAEVRTTIQRDLQNLVPAQPEESQEPQEQEPEPFVPLGPDQEEPAGNRFQPPPQRPALSSVRTTRQTTLAITARRTVNT